MAQFTPSKKTITDFNDGEEYLNKIDVVQADTVNNLVEGLLYAQENGGTTMLTEGREFGKSLDVNDYWLDVVGIGTDTAGYGIRADKEIKNLSLSQSEEQQLIITGDGDIAMSLSVDNGECLVLSNGEGSGQLVIEEVPPSLCLTQSIDGLVITEDNNELKIGDDKNNQLKIGE